MRARLFVLLALVAACSPYDPSLPHKPFLCGDTAPRCPDGYTCIAEGSLMVCSDSPAAPDAGVDASAAQLSALATPEIAP